MRIDVLHVVKTLSEYGGTGVKLRDYALRAEEESTVFYCTEEMGGLGYELLAQGFPVYSKKRWKYSPLTVVDIMRVIRLHDIDVVHTYFARENFWGRVAAIISRVPCVVSIEGMERNERLIFRKLNSFLDRFTSRFVCISRAVQRGLNESALKRSQVIYNGVSDKGFAMEELRKFSVIQRSELDLEGKLVVCYIGGLIESRRHEILLFAFRDLIKDVPDARLILVGDGPRRDYILSLIREHGLEEHVLWLGYCADAYRYIYLCDLYCNPTDKEGFGIATVDAMFLEKGIIVADAGGSSELIQDRENGLCFRAGSSQSLYETLRFAAFNTDYMCQLSRKARIDAIARFSVAQFVHNIGTVYQSVVRN